MTTVARVLAEGPYFGEGLHFPNGTVITSDGATLIVSGTLATRLTPFDIGSDGSLSNRRVRAALGIRAPDGACLDANGQVWVANATARQGRIACAELETAAAGWP
jgi:sugar lactone lactonase YvrE